MMKNPISGLFLLFFLLNHYNTLAQYSVTDYCCNATEIVVCPQNEMTLLTHGEQLFIDEYQNYVTFYQKEKKRSLWYKIYVNMDAELTFTIYPTDTTDVYNYLLFKEPDSGDFCSDVMIRKIIPERVNFLKDSMYHTGTGLSEGASANYSDVDSNNIREVLYHTAYHNALEAKAGDIYYLIVFHLSGDDCGHFLKLKTNDIIGNFRAVRKPCMNEIVTKTTTLITSGSTPDCKEIADRKREQQLANKRDYKIIVAGNIADSVTRAILQAKITYINLNTNESQIAQTDSSGRYQIVLKDSNSYQLICTSIGYKEKTITIDIAEGKPDVIFRHDFGLINLKEGDNFVLNNIYFYRNNYVIREESVPELENLFKFMQMYENAKVEIQGHTNGKAKIKKSNLNGNRGEGWDFRGNEKKLSKYRAEAVKKYLTNQGISTDRITAKGMGDSKMLYPKPRNQKQRDKNKRVEILILSMGDKYLSSK